SATSTTARSSPTSGGPGGGEGRRAGRGSLLGEVDAVHRPDQGRRRRWEGQPGGGAGAGPSAGGAVGPGAVGPGGPRAGPVRGRAGRHLGPGAGRAARGRRAVG